MAKTCRKCVTGDGRRGLSRDAKTVLALNAGSSSLKFGVYNVSATDSKELFSGSEETVDDEQEEQQIGWQRWRAVRRSVAR